jgi:hypothetical protein
MLYSEIIAVCSEIHTKHINTAVWAERGIVSVRAGGAYSDHCAVHIVTTGLTAKWIAYSRPTRRYHLHSFTCFFREQNERAARCSFRCRYSTVIFTVSLLVAK